MPYAKKIYITKVYEEFKGDAYFPSIDKSIWTIIERERPLKDPNVSLDFEYITYVRKR